MTHNYADKDSQKPNPDPQLHGVHGQRPDDCRGSGLILLNAGAVSNAPGNARDRQPFDRRRKQSKYVIGQVLAFLPGAQTFVSKNLDSISTISTGIILSCLFVMFWATSWMFTVIEKALNRVWGTYPRSFLHGRAVNIVVMSLVGVARGLGAVYRVRDRRASGGR